jgi:hypothetical protein
LAALRGVKRRCKLRNRFQIKRAGFKGGRHIATVSDHGPQGILFANALAATTCFDYGTITMAEF